MKMLFAFLCDRAVMHEGKVVAYGIGIDHIRAKTVPFKHSEMWFVGRYDDEPMIARKASVHIMGLSGFIYSVPLEVKPEPAAYRSVLVQLVDVVFLRYGDFWVEFRVEDRPLVQVPLHIVPAPVMTRVT